MPKGKKPSRQDKLAYLDAALKYVKKFSVAIDAGAHQGLWTQRMAGRFSHVYAYEPMPENVTAWKKRMSSYDNVTIEPVALGDRGAWCRMDGHGHSKHYAVVDITGPTRMVTLDSQGHNQCDFLKIDCEGADLLVLKGAESLLKRLRPVLIVEILREFEKRYNIGDGDLFRYLEGLGYRHVETHWRDYIFVGR